MTANRMLDIEIPTSTTRRRNALSLPTLEWSGAVLALAGAAVLSLNNAASRYVFVFFLASNLFLLEAARRRASTALFAMQVGFALTSLNGLRTWLLS
jgi:hypothetical protein